MNPKLAAILQDLLAIPPGQVTASLATENTPAWDSIAHLNICLSVEQEFGVQLTPEEMMQANSVAAIEDLLASHGRA